MAVTFADVVKIQPIDSHQYSIDLLDEYCIGTVPNGGYTATTFLMAASLHMQNTHLSRSQPHPISVHLEYLRRTSSGPALFTVKDIKLGARMSNIHLTLSQKRDPEDESSWEDEVVAYIIMSNLDTEEGLTIDTSYKLYPPRLPVDLVSLDKTGEDENWTRRTKDPFAKFRRAATNIQLHLMKPSRRPADRAPSMIDQWVRFTPRSHPDQPGRWTNDAIGFLVDVFPQIVEGYVNVVIEEAALTAGSEDELRALVNDSGPRAKYWYPTLALNLDIKKSLTPKRKSVDSNSTTSNDNNEDGQGVEWLFVRVRAKKICRGRFDLQVEVWDTDDDLVAISSHASLIVDSARNYTRNPKKKASESKI